ncbi:redoxin domain-containing protein [Planctomicrobium sp. SH668]|uniref:redoxin domain-containing protein n=1 Tax=Planctomicrobium sp. SH668 TaxID=3448126 RepID=UPI003F5C848F
MTTDIELTLRDAIDTVPFSTGQTLQQLSAGRKLLLVFLRHSGCTFCREALNDLKTGLKYLQENGIELACVHMSSEEKGDRVFEKAGLNGVPRRSDPEQRLYVAFGIKQGTASQLLGPSILWEGFQSAILRGYGFGLWDGNGFRMPGLFLLQDGVVIGSYSYKNASERPDYLNWACSQAETTTCDHRITLPHPS